MYNYTVYNNITSRQVLLYTRATNTTYINTANTIYTHIYHTGGLTPATKVNS